MKIIILNGSKKKGNTDRLIQLVIEKMLLLGDVEFEQIGVTDLNLEFCKSCHRCFLEGEDKCPHHEIVSALEQKLLEADGFIIASPIYVLHISASVKNVLDHFAYICHRPRFCTKKALIIVQTVGAGEVDGIKYFRKILKMLGVNKLYSLGIKIFNLEIKINPYLDKKISRIVSQFYQDLKSGQIHQPSFADIFNYNLWRAIISLQAKDNTFDYRYWEERGWLKTNYYFVISNPVKKLFSIILFKILSMIFKRMS